MQLHATIEDVQPQKRTAIMLRNIIISLAFIALGVNGYLWYSSGNLLSIGATIASAVVFLTAIVNKIDSTKKPPAAVKMRQKVGNHSSGIQVNGNLTINEKSRGEKQ